MNIPIGQIRTGPSSGKVGGGGSDKEFFLFFGHIILGGLIWHWTNWRWAVLYWSWPVVLGIVALILHPPEKRRKVRDTSGRYT